jgi:hypothetical protein
MIPLILYVTSLHWLIYRLHRAQKRHEAVTLALARALEAIASTSRPEAKDSKDSKGSKGSKSISSNGVH